MRKLVTIEKLLRQAKENGDDLSDIAIDEADIVDLSDLDAGADPNPEDQDD